MIHTTSSFNWRLTSIFDAAKENSFHVGELPHTFSMNETAIGSWPEHKIQRFRARADVELRQFDETDLRICMMEQT